jgi:hypothetical protein
MHRVKKGQRFARPAVLILASLVIAACGTAGGASDNAGSLLNQTFSGTHKVQSGSMSVVLTAQPSGSSSLKGAITFGLGGPFESRGKGKLPKSNFTITLGANGKSVSLGMLSTGTAGYVTLQRTSYRLPQATFQKLESSFAQAGAGPGGGSGSSGLGRLGIHPLTWLHDPVVVGNDNVAGASTTHIRAAVDVTAFVSDASKFVQNASSLGVSGANRFPGGLPANTRSQLVNAIRNPTVDVWTGTSDKTLRRLQIGLTVPVSGKLSSAAGGLSSAGIGFTLQYVNLNQPQTITAPATVRPFSEFSAKVRGFLQGIQGGLGQSRGTSSAAAGSGSSSASSVQNYSKCIQAAGNDVTKMQRCASLLRSG